MHGWLKEREKLRETRRDEGESKKERISEEVVLLVVITLFFLPSYFITSEAMPQLLLRGLPPPPACSGDGDAAPSSSSSFSVMRVSGRGGAVVPEGGRRGRADAATLAVVASAAVTSSSSSGALLPLSHHPLSHGRCSWLWPTRYVSGKCGGVSRLIKGSLLGHENKGIDQFFSLRCPLSFLSLSSIAHLSSLFPLNNPPLPLPKNSPSVSAGSSTTAPPYPPTHPWERRCSRRLEFCCSQNNNNINNNASLLPLRLLPPARPRRRRRRRLHGRRVALFLPRDVRLCQARRR